MKDGQNIIELRTWEQMKADNDGAIWIIDGEFCRDYVRDTSDPAVQKLLKKENVPEWAKPGFNGLYRVNKKGLFNVPMGKYKKPTICDKENLLNVSKALRNVEIHCASYEKCKGFVADKTLIYFDPPYRPLSTTASFNSYTKDNFDDNEQIKLAEFVKDLLNENVFVVLSNSDPKNIDKNDNFFDELYAFLTIKRIPVARCINSNTSKRGKITEILAYNTDLEVF